MIRVRPAPVSTAAIGRRLRTLPRMVANTADPALDGVARRAIRDVFPLYLPTVPFALVLGVAMTESAMSGCISSRLGYIQVSASQKMRPA